MNYLKVVHQLTRMLPTSSRLIGGLLRKEVIQPLVLERLPCYDFTPIIEPTFGRASPFGLGYGLRVFPTLMV